MVGIKFKRLILLPLLSIFISGCNFESSDISQELVKFVFEKRQKVLETAKSEEVYHWKHGKINGYMYIVQTTKNENGIYCRKMYEKFVSGVKEAELYNEWCRVGDKKWAIKIK